MKINNLFIWVLSLILVFIHPESAHADEAISNANTAWILTSTALVLFMTLPGLAFFYGGLRVAPKRCGASD